MRDEGYSPVSIWAFAIAATLFIIIVGGGTILFELGVIK